MKVDIREASKLLLIEAWTLYAIGIIVVVLRLWGRQRRNGWSRFHIDDYLMIIAAVFYTIFTYTTLATSAAYRAADSSSTNLMSLVHTHPKAYGDGSKWGMVAEEFMTDTLYLVKGSILIFYHRLTLGRRTEIIVKLIAGYTVFCWVGSQLAFFILSCNPFSGNWTVPIPSIQCVLWGHYAICQGFLNISSDVLILLIPIQIFIRTKFPLQQKIMLCCVFGVGIFLIICAIINKILMNTGAWQHWNCREASMAIYISNVPGILSLIRTFRKRKFENNMFPGGVYTNGTKATNFSHYSIEQKNTGPPPCPELAEWPFDEEPS